MASQVEQTVAKLLAGTGVTLNGSATYDLQVHNPRFYHRVLAQGSLGFGESYMDGWWDCDALDELISRFLTARLEKQGHSWRLLLPFLWSHLLNLQSGSRAFTIGRRHYDLGNDLYETMLDARMTYTCGYWQKATTLDEAQEAKLDLVCRKLNLKRGQRVLDIGCGWGSFAGFAAEKYGANVVGVTVSKEQVALAKQRYPNSPVEFRLADYRTLNEKFNHIVSLGMFEHVGVKNYRTYFQVARRCLDDAGLFLLHTIGGNRSVHNTDPWIEKYIFPNSMLPSAAQITAAMEGLFIMEDWHSFGTDYDKTLLAWWHNVQQHWPELQAKYGERFYRMWRFYLLACAGSFRARKNQLWQIVLSPNGVPGGYSSIR